MTLSELSMPQSHPASHCYVKVAKQDHSRHRVDPATLDTDCPANFTAHMPEPTTPHFRKGRSVTQLGEAAVKQTSLTLAYPLRSREPFLAIWLLHRAQQSGLAKQNNLVLTRQNTVQYSSWQGK